MRFGNRMLVTQLATQVCVVTVCAVVFLWLGVQQLRAEAESSALNIARSVAEAPQVRELVASFSAESGTPDAAELRGGALQRFANDVATRTGSLFVVITDDQGIRLAHPTPSRLGQVVSTSFAEALAGREVVTWEAGTLGESARAKVPVFPPGGGRPVGEVSVGFERASVFDDLPALVLGIALATVAALVLGAAASLLMRRRLERVTLGVQPEELVALVQTQTAVLEGSSDGVVAIDTAGVVRVCNDAAERMLGIAAPEDRSVAALPVAPAVADALHAGAPEGIVLDDRVVYVDVRPVSRGGRDLGTVAVLRDRTDLLALTDRLESVRTLGDALRAQRHEFANRLHAVAGLLDAGRTEDARSFVAELAERGAIDYRLAGTGTLAEPLLQSFLGAKAVSARERGVALSASDDTLVRGRIRDVEDVVAVLGNLLDNAIGAAAAGPEPRWVEVTLLDDGDELVMSVADSGAGVADGVDVFAGASNATAEDAPDRVHGHGIGLPLSRELARRRGGEVWLIEAGGAGTGAVFGARLPGAMESASADQPNEQDREDRR